MMVLFHDQTNTIVCGKIDDGGFNMRFVFAGGAREVGGSCIYLRVNHTGILMDAGIRQSASKDPLPDFRSIQEQGGVDYILISHAHMDHTGSLPIISKAYPAAPIYMTPMTMDLTRILLADSIKIMNRSEGDIPHYSEEDVNTMFQRVIPVPFETPYAINDHFSFTFYPAGHIAGAACIYLKTPEGTVFYSGDVSSFRQQTIEGMRIPRLRPDVGLFESTYGNRLHANRDAEEQKLVDTVKECVQQGYKVLIPAFALGRAQEVLLILQRAMKRKELGEVPVYVDGMIREITNCYLQHPNDLRSSVARKIQKGQNPFYSDCIQPVPVNVNREELLMKSGPAVLIASSGMLTGGPSMVYAKALIPEEKACIIITGYQDEEAPGRVLLSMMNDAKEDKSVSLDGTLLPVHCKVVQVGLSAHSDKSELTSLIEKTGCRRIILVHGDADAMNDLGEELSADYRVHVYEPSVGNILNLDIYTPRKQITNTFTHVMHGTDLTDPSEQKALYAFWNENYHLRSFTVQELYTIYTGKSLHAERMTAEEKDELHFFAKTLEDSVYFSRDPKRMYLFHTNTEEEIAEAQKKQEPMMQDVEALIKYLLKDVPIRRLSFYQDAKTVQIVSDYPDTFDATLLDQIQKEVTEKTGWQVELNPSVNYQAMGMLVQSLFPERVLKISYHEDQKNYVIRLGKSIDTDKDSARTFEKTTGWHLSIETAEATQIPQNQKIIPDAGKPMEQNAAISFIKNMFSNQTIQPYRISIRNSMDGRYLELSFISPEAGHIYDDLLKQCSDQTHWSLKVSDSVNQNAAQMIAIELCKKYKVHTEKAASYQPATHKILIKTNDDIPEKMKQEFRDRTGLTIDRK